MKREMLLLQLYVEVEVGQWQYLASCKMSSMLKTPLDLLHSPKAALTATNASVSLAMGGAKMACMPGTDRRSTWKTEREKSVSSGLPSSHRGMSTVLSPPKSNITNRHVLFTTMIVKNKYRTIQY